MGDLNRAMFLTALVLCAPAAWCANSVVFHDGAQVRRPEIILSDIADITADTDSLKAELSQVKIGKAAIPGFNRRFDTERIAMTYLAPFRKRGVVIAVTGPKEVSIITASRTLSEITITEILRKQIFARAPFAKDNIQISFISVPDKVVIPDTECQLLLEPKEDCDWRGNEAMQVLVRCGQTELKKFPVSLRFRVFETVCVTDGKIKRGTLLAASDIRTEIREITDITDRVYLAPSEIIGKETSQTLIPGLLFTDRNVNNPPIVRKGERVRIIVRNNSATVEIDGIARENGAMGDRIRVRSQLNQKLVTGFVSGEGMVTLASDYNGGVL